MNSILSIQNISKNYGRIKAVDNLSLEIPAGSIYGILGPNGSGKTTTLGIVLGVIKGYSGSYEWFGNPPSKYNRRKIGAILENPNFYPYMSALNNLKISCKIKNVPVADCEKVLKRVNLWERSQDPFQTYSLGMKQRLALASALLGDPKVLVLDEPTNGLDPAGIASMRTLIKNLGDQGMTIFLASHLLDEVEKVCDHVAVLMKGKLIENGSVQEMFKQENYLELGADNMDLLKTVLNGISEIEKIEPIKGLFLVHVKEGFPLSEINRKISEHGIVLNHFSQKKKSLEDHFLEITK